MRKSLRAILEVDQFSPVCHRITAALRIVGVAGGEAAPAKRIAELPGEGECEIGSRRRRTIMRHPPDQADIVVLVEINSDQTVSVLLIDVRVYVHMELLAGIEV